MAQGADWTDTLLASWSANQAGFDPAPYDVTSRISRIALHISRHQEEVFGRFGLNRGDVGMLSALRFAGPSNQLTPTQLFKGLMLSWRGSRAGSTGWSGAAWCAGSATPTTGVGCWSS